MKINLLREDQMTKVPHQDKEKEVLSFDDTFSGGNDDFYFQQPSPSSEEYRKPPRKFRIWLFVLLLIIFLLVGAYISNPSGTRDFFKNIGSNIALTWDRGVSKAKNLWRQRNDKDLEYLMEQPERKDIPGTPKVTPKPEEKKEVAKSEAVKKPVEAPVVVVEKQVIKEVVKETVDEKIVESPPVYESIRDELALSIRNITAAELVWSKVPGGMIMDRLHISEDKLSVSVMSRHAMLIQTYSNVLEQHDMFTSFLQGEPEQIDEFTRIQLTSDLPPYKKEDRPARIWDLNVEWFDDYLDIAAENANVNISMEQTDTRELEKGVLQHDIKLTVTGNRTSMSLLFKELRNIPAAFFVREIASTYFMQDQSNILELVLVYYERE